MTPRGNSPAAISLGDQRVPLAPLYLLLRQSSHVFLRSLFAPGLRQPGVPVVLLFLDGNLAFPFRVQKILPLFRRILLGNQFRMIADGSIDNVDGAPVAVGIRKSRDEVLGLR